MKILVTTKLTQGKRKNDFCFIDEEDEPVGFVTECDGEAVDGGCGCRRCMQSLISGKMTTTMKVVESTVDLKELIKKRLTDNGWAAMMSPKEFDDLVRDDYRSILTIAMGFPPGAVVEKRGNIFKERK